METVVAKATATTKGPMHVIRGSGLQEKMLKNAKTEYFNEHEEIATYLAIEVFAKRSATERPPNWRGTSAARRNGWRSSSRGRSNP